MNSLDAVIFSLIIVLALLALAFAFALVLVLVLSGEEEDDTTSGFGNLLDSTEIRGDA